MHFNPGIGNNDWGNKVTGVFSFQTGIGYQFDRLVLASGLGYMRSGYEIPIVDAGSNVGKEKYHINHLVLPLSIGYKLKLGKQCALTPVLGVNVAYNYSLRDVLLINHQKHIENSSGRELRESIRPVGLFGLVRVNLEFLLTSRLSIVASPSFNYMLNNVLTGNNTSHDQLHPYTFMLNAGVKWSLAKAKDVKTGK